MDIKVDFLSCCMQVFTPVPHTGSVTWAARVMDGLQWILWLPVLMACPRGMTWSWAGFWVAWGRKGWKTGFSSRWDQEEEMGGGYLQPLSWPWVRGLFLRFSGEICLIKLTRSEKHNGLEAGIFSRVDLQGLQLLHLLLEDTDVVHESHHPLCRHGRRVQAGCCQQRSHVERHGALGSVEDEQLAPWHTQQRHLKRRHCDVNIATRHASANGTGALDDFIVLTRSQRPIRSNEERNKRRIIFKQDNKRSVSLSWGCD